MATGDGDIAAGAVWTRDLTNQKSTSA
jgi:hypothetical protein